MEHARGSSVRSCIGVAIRRTHLPQPTGRLEDLSQHETRRVRADRDERRATPHTFTTKYRW